jgi:HD superfamily phosphohydrolase
LKQIEDGIAAKSFRVYHIHDVSDDDYSMILTSRDWIFIKEAILGAPLFPPETTAKKDMSIQPDESGFCGRTNRSQEFLYDIVAHRHSGLDVDKMDYFARDERRTEKGNGEVDRRLIEEALVAWGACPKPHACFRCLQQPQNTSSMDTNTKRNQHLMIVWPTKCAELTCAFFHRRFRNLSRVYTHKSTQASTFMICDILTLADPFYRIQVVDDHNGKNHQLPSHSNTDGAGLPISRAMLDPEAYLLLRDSIIDQIEVTERPELKPARLLIRRLRARDMYKCCATKKISLKNETERQVFQNKTESEIANELFQLGGCHDVRNGTCLLKLTKDDFLVEKLSIHLGCKEENPLTLLRFVPKHELHKLTRGGIHDLPEAIQVDEKDYETHLPRSFQEHSIRVFCKTNEKLELLRQVFEQWWSKQEGMMEGTEEKENSIVHLMSQEPCDTPAKSMSGPDDLSPMQSVRFRFEACQVGQLPTVGVRSLVPSQICPNF